MFYTQAQIRDVVEYAAERGIRVMPEFDVPGHSTSWFVAYPEYASAPGPYAIERRFGVFGPAFDPTNERIYPFFDAFLKEMAGLFPDPYLHIGGDEVEGHQWDANPAIQAFKKKHGLADNGALQAYFNGRLLKILTRHGKKMVGWDEILQPGLPKDIVIHSWRGQESLVEAARKGYQGILSNGYYIDLCHPAADHYLNDPIPAGSPLDESQKALILGGEATMWSELVTPETIDSRIWPRTAAIAERLWSPAVVRDVDDMYRRLPIVSLRLEELGLLHLKNPDMLLRRLAGNAAIEPLKILAEAVEPLEGYERHGQAAYTSLSPFTRFVDACAPESLPARSLGKQVERYLAGERPDRRRGDRGDAGAMERQPRLGPSAPGRVPGPARDRAPVARPEPGLRDRPRSAVRAGEGGGPAGRLGRRIGQGPGRGRGTGRACRARRGPGDRPARPSQRPETANDGPAGTPFLHGPAGRGLRLRRVRPGAMGVLAPDRGRPTISG